MRGSERGSYRADRQTGRGQEAETEKGGRKETDRQSRKTGQGERKPGKRLRHARDGMEVKGRQKKNKNRKIKKKKHVLEGTENGRRKKE